MRKERWFLLMEDNFGMGYAMGQESNNNGNGMFGGDGWWAIILFALIFGWGGRGYGGFGGFGGMGDQGAATNYVLGSDFSMLSRQLSDGFNGQERKLDSIANGLCDGFYTTAQLANGINSNISASTNATQMALMQGFNGVQTQLADCCCKTQQNIKDVGTQTIMNTSAIQQQIERCCCDNEKIALTNRFEAERANNATLTAIDKLGDRIIDFMCADKTQALRDENQALRLAASQAAQNSYIINAIRPYPVPAFQSCNPYAYLYGNGGTSGGCCG